MTLEDIITWSGGACYSHGDVCHINGLSTDSRLLRPGNFFIALVGQKFDGHDFIPQAIEAGVSGVVVSRPVSLPQKICVISVEDTTEALKRIANGHRCSLNAQVIVVVGSNGKTTCKNMLSCILSKKHRVTKTHANNNNKIGVSLTLLSADFQDEYIIVEAGTNSPGEIAELCRIIEPNHALVTNISAEHLQGFGDLEGVFREEASVLGYLRESSFVSLQRDDAYFHSLLGLTKCRPVSSGFDLSSDFLISEWRSTAESQQFVITEQNTSVSAPVRLNCPGKHMAKNAALSIALACRLGTELEEAAQSLTDFSPEKGRLNIIETNGRFIIDDTYNANPAAMCAALDVLEIFPGKKAAILGDMGELGADSAELHRDVARHISKKNIDLVIGVGTLALNYSECGKPFYHFKTTDHALTGTELELLLRSVNSILVKGSRFMKMELIVSRLAEVRC